MQALPAELTTEIFCLLPSLSDVFAVAATCHQFRYVWMTNVTQIYHQVAPRSIPCERYARRFRADQGGPAMECWKLSPGDVVCMVRNACVVEKAILQFEREIVRRVRSMFCDKSGEETCGANSFRKPVILRSKNTMGQGRANIRRT